MANAFDQFDQPQGAANPFDQFDQPAASQAESVPSLPQQVVTPTQFAEYIPPSAVSGAELNRMAEQEIPQHPVLENIAGAVTDVARGVPGMISQIPEQAYQGIKFAAGGSQERVQVLGEALKQAIPQGQQIAQDLNAPVGSREFARGAINLGMIGLPAVGELAGEFAIRPSLRDLAPTPERAGIEPPPLPTVPTTEPILPPESGKAPEAVSATAQIQGGGEIPSATQERQIQEGYQPKYPGDETIRPPAEAGGGGGVVPSTEVRGGVAPEAVAPISPEQPQVSSEIRKAVDSLDFDKNHSGAPDLANDLENISGLPKPLKNALDQYREAEKGDREEYGMRSGEAGHYGDLLESEARKWASPEARVTEPQRASRTISVDVSPITNAKSIEEATSIAGRMVIEAKTDADIKSVQSAIRQWKSPAEQPRIAPTTGEPIEGSVPTSPEVRQQTGISNQRLTEAYGDFAPVATTGKGPGAWKDVGTSRLDNFQKTGAVANDPYSVLTNLREGRVPVQQVASDVSLLRAEHQRLLEDARNSEGTPEYADKSKAALDMANAIKGVAHGPASDVFRALQEYDKPRYDNVTDFDQALRERIGRESTPEEKAQFGKVANDVKSTRNGAEEAINGAQKRLSRMPKMDFDSAASSIREQIAELTKDCV